MKKILNSLKQYFHEEIKLTYFIAVILFAAITIWLQVQFHLSNKLVEHHKRENTYWLRAFILYAIPFFGTFLLYSLFYKRWDFWKNFRFLFLIIFILLVYSFRCNQLWHVNIVNATVDNDHRRYWIKVSNQIVYGFTLLILPLAWWYFNDRKKEPLYGFNFRNISLKPYFMVLLLLVPLVGIASTQSDFLSAYPRYANSFNKGEIFHPLYCALFEFSYGFDFLMNEFFFRGFIILALAKYLKRGGVLPMAMFYVFIHFGKPLGEVISSFFGGLILGVVAYETRSIYGGAILHIGIAWMMEIGAAIGRGLLN